jgi:Fe-S cluster assembly protein SufD
MSINNIGLDSLALSLASKQAKADAASLERYAAIPVPSKKDELYRHSVVHKLFSQNLLPAAPIKRDAPAELTAGSYDARLVFSNGYFLADISVLAPGKLQAEQRPVVLQAGCADKFEALANIFAPACTKLTVPAGQSAAIQIIQLGSSAEASMSNTSISIELGIGAKASITELHERYADGGAANISTAYKLGRNSSLDLTVLNNFSDKAACINNITASQDEGSTFQAQLICLSGGQLRNKLRIEQAGPNCATNIYGLSVPSGTQHFDCVAEVRHLSTGGTTDEIFKAAPSGKSTSIFAGSIYVAEGAQKTQASQSNKNILLSDEAAAHSKPQLEIYADDVSCSHGSTTGQLDEQQIFYMRARGISRKAAIKLMLEGFFADITGKICKIELRERIAGLVAAKL